MTENNTLFCFGLGFTTTTLGRELLAQGWTVSGTTRNQQKADALKAEGFDVVLLDKEGLTPCSRSFQQIEDRLEQASHILVSAPPNETGDPVIALFSGVLASLVGKVKWFGYLSTIGVYGEHHGAWIDETAEQYPVTRRSQWRQLAELQWQGLAADTGLPLHIFRLPGIYGQGRNQMVTLQKGKSRRLVKEGQVFNRIHVEDIAQVLRASMAHISPGEIYNISDDLPAPPQDVVAYAAELLGMKSPPVVRYEDADLTPMARSFYGECKRIQNEKIKQELGVRLKYPTYKEGLAALYRHSKSD